MRVVYVFVFGLFLMAAGCSNNKGKIVGKWESTDAPLGLKYTMVFAADGKLTLTVDNQGQVRTVTGSYLVGSGDTVYFKNLSEPVQGKKRTAETIRINGNELRIMDDADNWLTFKKV